MHLAACVCFTLCVMLHRRHGGLLVLRTKYALLRKVALFKRKKVLFLALFKRKKGACSRKCVLFVREKRTFLRFLEAQKWGTGRPPA